MTNKIADDYKISLKGNAFIFAVLFLTLILTSVVAVAAKNNHDNTPASRRPVTPPGLLNKQTLPPGIRLHRPTTPPGLSKK